MDWNSTLARLKADEARWADIARATGLSGMQVRRIARGETKWPRLDTMQKLAAHYEQSPSQPEAA